MRNTFVSSHKAPANSLSAFLRTEDDIDEWPYDLFGDSLIDHLSEKESSTNLDTFSTMCRKHLPILHITILLTAVSHRVVMKFSLTLTAGPVILLWRSMEMESVITCPLNRTVPS